MKKVYLRASLTVEAVFIVPVITILIIFILYMNFYIHDMTIINSWLEANTLMSANDSDSNYENIAGLKSKLWIAEITSVSENNEAGSKAIEYKMKLNSLIEHIAGTNQISSFLKKEKHLIKHSEARRFITAGKEAVSSIPYVNELLEEWLK